MLKTGHLQLLTIFKLKLQILLYTLHFKCTLAMSSSLPGHWFSAPFAIQIPCPLHRWMLYFLSFIFSQWDNIKASLCIVSVPTEHKTTDTATVMLILMKLGLDTKKDVTKIWLISQLAFLSKEIWHVVSS